MTADAQLAPEETAPAVRRQETAVFDGHNDTLLRLELAERRGRFADPAAEPESVGGRRVARLDIDFARARAGGLRGGLFAMFTPSGLLDPAPAGADEAVARDAPVEQTAALGFTMALFARLRRLARAHPDEMTIATDAGAIRRAMASGRIAAVPHVEGAECIDTDLAALEVLYVAGLRSLGPVWSRANAFGHGAPMAAQPEPDEGEGLTQAGRALVMGCEAMGVLIDCSHLTQAGFWDVARVSDQPLVASHSNAHAVSPSARNLTDRQLDAIAERGGLVGLNFHVAFLRPDCRHDRDTPIEVMLRHLDHLLARLGEDGVALGSDFDGCLLPRAISDVAGLPRLVEAMRAAGYGEALIAKIARENWLRMLERVIG
ncbi:MAG: dipeptidase [Paracoccaceae bacterium]